MQLVTEKQMQMKQKEKKKNSGEKWLSNSKYITSIMQGQTSASVQETK